MLDDSVLYTGIDQEPAMFEQEKPEQDEKEEEKSRLVSGDKVDIEVLFKLLDAKIEKLNKISNLDWSTKASDQINIAAKIESIANYINFINDTKQLITDLAEEQKKR